MDLMHITKNNNFNNKSSPKGSIAIPSSQQQSISPTKQAQKNKQQQPNKNAPTSQQSATTLPVVPIVSNTNFKTQQSELIPDPNPIFVDNELSPLMEEEASPSLGTEDLNQKQTTDQQTPAVEEFATEGGLRTSTVDEVDVNGVDEDADSSDDIDQRPLAGLNSVGRNESVVLMNGNADIPSVREKPLVEDQKPKIQVTASGNLKPPTASTNQWKNKSTVSGSSASKEHKKDGQMNNVFNEDGEQEYANQARYEAEILAKYIAKQSLLNKNTNGQVFLPQLIINLQYTQYDVLRDVAETIDYQISWSETDDPDWDVYWLDSAINPQFLFKMQPYQRVNHFTGMHTLARKNLLARNLQAMQRKCPDDYDFFPPTWILPQDAKDFKIQFNNKKAKTFIVKPEASCQGKGIFLTRGFDWMQNTNEHFVAQRYLHKPYLISGLKFDLRIYVLVTGVNPLRAYITKEGLARFATEKYQKPGPGNLNNMMMHLTNYAINKESMEFVFNRDPERDDVGHKRSLKAVLRSIDNRKHFLKEGETMVTSEEIWASIKDIILKTLITAQPSLAHAYRTAKPDDLENSLCFQILGFDIFLDKDSKPWLLEVNHTPSFTTDTPLDMRIKKNLIADTIRLLGLSVKRKMRYQAQRKIEQQRRMLTGYNQKTRMSQDEKDAIREKKQNMKDKIERENMGQFEHLYPLDPRADEEKVQKYELFLQRSKEIFEETQAQGTSFKKSNKDVKEVTQKQIDFMKGQNSFHHNPKRNANNLTASASEGSQSQTAPLPGQTSIGSGTMGTFVGPAMGGGFKAIPTHKLLEKQLLQQQQMNAAVGLRINSRMHMTHQVSSGPGGMLEMIEEVENMTNGETNPEGSTYMVDQSGYSDAQASRLLAEANGGELPNKVLYGFPPSYPVRNHQHMMQNYGKYILENNSPYDTNINFENTEDPLAGLIVSRNLDPATLHHARYTDYGNSTGNTTLPLMPGGHLDKMPSTSYNASPNKHGGRGALIHQQQMTANFPQQHNQRFYQVLDHMGNQPMSEKTLVVQQYRQKLENNVSGKHIMTPFQQTLINFQRAQITRQMNAAGDYTPQPSALYMPNPNLSYQYKQSFLQSQFNSKLQPRGGNKSPSSQLQNYPTTSQQYYDLLKKQYKEKMLILDSTKHVVPPPIMNQSSQIAQQIQLNGQQQGSFDRQGGTNKKLPNMLNNQNGMIQGVSSTYASVAQQQNSNTSMHVKTLAPLPPSHYSAGKAKGGGPNLKPYLTLSVEKTSSVGTLHKSNSKKKLATIGNSVVQQSNTQQHNQDLGNITPPTNLFQEKSNSHSHSTGNPISKIVQAPLIQLEDTQSMKMHGLSINRLITQNQAGRSNTPLNGTKLSNMSKQTAATTANLQPTDSVESL